MSTTVLIVSLFLVIALLFTSTPIIASVSSLSDDAGLSMSPRFLTLNDLPKDVYNIISDADDDVYHNLCGGPIGSCVPEMVITHETNSTLGFSFASSAIDNPIGYIAGGIDTRDKYLIKQINNTATRLCFNLTVDFAQLELNKGVNALAIGLMSNNAYNNSETTVLPNTTKSKNPSEGLLEINLHYNRETYTSLLTSAYSFVPENHTIDNSVTVTRNINLTALFSVEMTETEVDKEEEWLFLDRSPQLLQLCTEYGPEQYSVYINGLSIFYIRNGDMVDDKDGQKVAIQIFQNIDYFFYIHNRIISQPDKDTTFLSFDVNNITLLQFEEDDKRLNIKIGLIALAIFLGASIIAFLLLACCATTLNKKQDTDYYKQQEQALLNN